MLVLSHSVSNGFRLEVHALVGNILLVCVAICLLLVFCDVALIGSIDGARVSPSI